jgi:peptidoglycan hydrolase CwlO-like protein
MSLKESLQQKLETQTEYWSKQVQALQAEADEKMAKAKDDQAEARIQKEMSEKIESLENQIEEARQKLAEVKDSSEDKLSELTATINDWLPSNTN